MHMPHIHPRRRAGAALATAIALTLGVSACSGQAAVQESQTPDEPVTIDFWTFAPSLDETFQGVFDDFEAANPNVTVKLKSSAYGDYVPALQAAIQAGDEPALYFPATLPLQLAAADKVVDLKELLGKDFIDQFFPSTTRLAEYNGGNYAIPISASMFGVFYNKTMFEEHGWDIPETWDEMMALGKRIRAEANITPIAITGNNGSGLASFTWPMITQVEDSTDLAYALDAHTDSSVSWNSKPVIKAFTKVRELVDSGLFDPGVLGVDVDAAKASFYSGSAAMYFASSAWYTVLQQEAPDFAANDLGLFQAPAWESGARHWTGNQAGYTLSMKKGLSSAEQAASEALIQFMYDPTRYPEWQKQASQIPATIASVDSNEDPFIQLYAKWLEEGDGAPHISLGAGTGDAIGKGAAQLFGGQGTPAEIAQQIEDAVVQARKL